MYAFEKSELIHGNANEKFIENVIKVKIHVVHYFVFDKLFFNQHSFKFSIFAQNSM